jgi:cobalamin biosynthesis Mg chelatase CobN
MTELWIKFKDENGEEKRVAVDKEQFMVGRHSESDLCIPNGKLSREHLRIERFADIFVVSDTGSSNGTELNDEPLARPAAIKNGDRANLGGGLDIEFELISDDPDASASNENANSEADNEDANTTSAGTVAMPAAEESAGFPMTYLLLAALLGLFLVVFSIGAIYFFSSGTSTEEANNNPYRTGYPNDDPSPEKTATTSSPSSSPSGTTTTTGNTTAQPSPSNLGENAKVEQSAAAFLRKIAQHDSTAFLTSEQSKKVNDKIKQISSSSALADNINSARKNSSQLKSLAAAKGLPVQLLATAALTKLGSSRGDVLQTAQSMSEILSKLQTQIGSELFDDSLMMIAAYDQGEKGDFQKLRNMLQDLATKFPESSRAIRSIWFLQKNGKITDAEFDFALRFIAIGTITQNPKDFGVNTEPLAL